MFGEGDGGDAGYGGNVLDGLYVGEGEAAFLVLVASGELVYDAADEVFVGAGADDDEVGADGFDLVGDEALDAAG